MVHIETDHKDDDEAARSVMNALKRAGYDVLDAQLPGTAWSVMAVRGTMQEYVMYADPILITAAEPETDARMRA
jgi:hypothetical protein